MNKDAIDLLLRMFTPLGALVVAITLGLLTTLYTVFLKFLFDRRLKDFESGHARELAELQGRLAGQNQVILQSMQDENARALKRLEAELTAHTQGELQKSQAALSEEQSKKQSRLDYEYEARKRLYHECEPLIFELLEFAENARDRIQGLATTARHGDLPDWLATDSYYMASTMYYLLAPVAVYKLMRRRLTVVDMRLDQNIGRHYTLCKQIAWSFVDDFNFAWGLKVCPIAYKPNDADWKNLRAINESVYWRQGLPYGRLDNAVESLIIRDPQSTGELRIRSFGEFESALYNPGTVRDTFIIVRDIFTNFHPARRPVLWRILVAQSHIYSCIVRFHQQSRETVVITALSAAERNRLEWTRTPTGTERQQMEDAFTVAEAYLSKHLGELWRSKPKAAAAVL
jgi:hypothetical protein